LLIGLSHACQTQTIPWAAKVTKTAEGTAKVLKKSFFQNLVAENVLLMLLNILSNN
jgi:hypothetical protein